MPSFTACLPGKVESMDVGVEIIGNIFIVPIHLGVKHREPPVWAASPRTAGSENSLQ